MSVEDRIEESSAPLIEHLAELRTRLIRSVLAFVVAMVACFTIAQPLLSIIQEPLVNVLVARGQSPELIFTAPQEQFFVLVRISIIAGFAVSFPVIAHQLWRFVAPGLYRNEKKAIISVTAAGAILFITGAAFAWFIIREPALTLFQSFETGKITGFWSVSSYIDFIGTLLLVFGTAFQLPLAVLFLVKTGIAEPADLTHYRRHILVGLLVIAAILTPPDPFTQIMLSLPLYILFELSLLVARIAFRKGKSD